MRSTLAAAALAALLAGGISACNVPAESTETPSVESTRIADYETGDDAASIDDDAVDESSPEPAPKPVKAKMLSVEGMNLQVAEHKLEQKGFTNVLPLPVDGHAFVANPANWVVVGQDPASGKRVAKDTEITLEVAKTEEAENSVCLDGDC